MFVRGIVCESPELVLNSFRQVGVGDEAVSCNLRREFRIEVSTQCVVQHIRRVMILIGLTTRR